MAGPYSDLGNILNRAKKKKEKRVLDRKLSGKKYPAGMSAINEMGYISENGLDRRDAELYTKDRKAFRNNVDDMFRRNEGKLMRRGMVTKDYRILQAQRNGEKKK